MTKTLEHKNEQWAQYSAEIKSIVLKKIPDRRAVMALGRFLWKNNISEFRQKFPD